MTTTLQKQSVYRYVTTDNDRDMRHTLRRAVPVAYDTFMRRVGFNAVKEAPFFDGKTYTRNGQGGRSLKQEDAIGFFRSVYRGAPCYVIRYNGMPYVFQPEPEGPVIECESTTSPAAFALVEPSIERPEYESGQSGYKPDMSGTFPRGRLNKRRCWLVRLILRAIRAYTERHPRETGFSWISIAMDRFNGPVIYGRPHR